MEIDIKADLSKLLQSAFEVARHMTRYRSRVQVQSKGPSDPGEVARSFDGKWMDIGAASIGDHKDIDLLYAPALVTYGKLDGSDVEHMRVLGKALVCYRNGSMFYTTDEYREKWGKKMG